MVKISYKNFEQMVKYSVQCKEKAEELYKVGIDIHDLILDPYWGIINPLIETIFTEQQIYLIDEFIDNNHNQTVEQLWQQLNIES